MASDAPQGAMASEAAGGAAASGAPRPEDRGWLGRLLVAGPGELLPVLMGFLLFFLLFASYFMLRPVRETFGIAGGVNNLQWLFLATFLATLVVLPAYGWLSNRVPRRRLLPVCYGVSAATLVGFGFVLLFDPEDVWAGRVFYVWLSVFNLFVISLAWSLMADVFQPDQAKRLFGQIAAGASLGGLAGPLLSTALVAPLGLAGLLFLSAAMLLGTLVCAAWLFRWRDRQGWTATPTGENADRAMRGSVIAGLTLVLRSPYLLGIALFVILLASVSTFLYFEQARLVRATFPSRVQQTQVFGTIDAVVQTLTILIQVFVTGRLTRRLGVGVLLTAVPLGMAVGFGALALAPTFGVLVVVMVLRRVGEYALVRPGREMLFTTVDAETKYKAKNAIDTVVYRGGDAVSSWIKTGVDAVSSSPVAAMVVGVAIAAGWAATGYALGRGAERGEAARRSERAAA